ncbi:MAG TPA: hypothetical protein VHC90_13800 [Bryobacteraceae bacterium]|nr:hypothetical protein [Bryobacteraceae bacterium]
MTNHLDQIPRPKSIVTTFVLDGQEHPIRPGLRISIPGAFDREIVPE